MANPENIRNIAIIAHVDHGKTTLVDHLLKQSGIFGARQSVEERFMDSMDLEKERGITIAAKNCSFVYEGVKVNIVDTPGHSDFGGEVERILNMVDGCVLLVDASEGPLPQTRFVLKKALEQNLKILVCINKIDRSDARIDEVANEIFDLFIDLEARDDQMDYATIYAVGRDGIALKDYNKRSDDETLKPLFDLIISEVPCPSVNLEGPLQMMVSNIDYNDFVGHLAIGRIESGAIKVGDQVMISREDGLVSMKVSALFGYESSRQVKIDSLHAGDIGVVAGMSEVTIGDSLVDKENPQPLERLKVEEPTVGVIVSVNDGPFAGLEGDKVTSRKIKERLERELLYNVAIRVEETQRNDAWKLLGRGELQLSVLLEQMRREGFELLVSKPEVLLKKNESGDLIEPMENVTVDVSEEFVGVVTEKLGLRKGIMINMINKGLGRARVEFSIPARGLIGYRSEFLTDTRGTGLLNTQSAGYDLHKGEIVSRLNGAIVSDRKGKATIYAIDNLQDRGKFLISPGVEVYEGMIAGESAKPNDMIVNIVREKKLTNVRASGTDEAAKIARVKSLTLEAAMEWINDRELIEVTPKNIRLRCRELDPHKRKKQ